MIALLDRVVLAAGPGFSSLWILHANPFCTKIFLLRNQLIAYGNYLVGNYLSHCLYASFFVFNLCHFNYDVSWWGTLHAPWICVTISFTRLEKFSAIISSNRFSNPCSLFFFWYSYDANVVAPDVVPKDFRPSSFCKILFTFWYSVGVLTVILSSKLLTPSSATSNLTCYWFLLVYFSFKILYSLFLTSSFLWFLCNF